MDIGKFKNNTKFYDGYEPDTEISLSLIGHDEYNLHIYEGYFSDFFSNPSFDDDGWKGFTRDYNQIEQAFGDDDYVINDVKEYLDDLLTYADNKYEFDDTAKCFKLLREFLEYAFENDFSILVHVF